MNYTDIKNKLTEAGYLCYIVGGCVRDNLLKKHFSDIDLATNAKPEQIKEVFPDAIQTGENFPVMRVSGIEVATFRKDVGVDGWEFASTIYEDLARRDLTINAMAVLHGAVVDPHNGRQDLKDRIIRFVGVPSQRIAEDPVRMIRALRFAAKCDFKMADETIEAIKEHKHKLLNIPVERIWLEIMKVMDSTVDSPSWFFELAYMTGVLSIILPELENTYGQCGGLYHKETVWRHCMLTGDCINHKGNPYLRLAGYLHDIGKTPAWNGQNFRYHSEEGAVLVDNICKRYKVSKKHTDYLVGLTALHMRNVGEEVHNRTYRRLLRALDEYGVPSQDWLELRIADHTGNLKNIGNPYKWEWSASFKARCIKCKEQQDIGFTTKDLAITGKHLIENFGLTPSPLFGKMQSAMLELVIDEPAANNFAGLADFLEAEFGVKVNFYPITMR